MFQKGNFIHQITQDFSANLNCCVRHPNLIPSKTNQRKRQFKNNTLASRHINADMGIKKNMQ